jgi:hypothetical protein
MNMLSQKRTGLAIIVMLIGFCAAQPVFGQVKEGESKRHKRIWRRWSKKSDAYNPYVKHGKSTHEASRQQKREDDKAIRKAKKEYKKSIRRSARKRGGK